MQVGRHDLGVLAIKAFRKPFDEHALAVDIDAEEVGELEETQDLLLLLVQSIEVLGSVQGDELWTHEPLIAFQGLGPLDPREGIDEMFLRDAAQARCEFRERCHAVKLFPGSRSASSCRNPP